MSRREALEVAHARMSALVEKHRREQDSLFRELIETFAAEPLASVADVGGGANAAAPAHDAAGTQVGTAAAHLARAGSFVSCEPGHEEQAFRATLSSKADASKSMQRVEHVIEGLGVGSGPCYRRILLPLIEWIRWLGRQREPPRTGLLVGLVDGKPFSLLTFAVIALNSIFIVITTDYEKAHPSSELPELMLSLEMAFVVFYCVELCLKLIVHRHYFLLGPESHWNWLDVVLVMISLFDVVFSDAAVQGVSVGFMRSLRLFKLAKILRVFRSIRFFSELRLMFDCVLGSLVSLIWCLAMVFFIAYVFALLIVQGLAAELRDPDGAYSAESEAELLREFGSVGLGMLSLLKSTTGGRDWGTVLDLLALCGGFVPVAFVVYIVFFALAAWNIVTSLFVERALKIAQPDVETLALEQNMQDIVDADELTSIFAEMDTDKSGTISMAELQSVMKHPKFRSYLRVRGIDIQDARFFYRMMQSVVRDTDGDIDLRFVVSACLRMKGVATSMDLHALTFESKLLNKKHKHHIDGIGRRLSVIEDRLTALLEERLRQPPNERAGPALAARVPPKVEESGASTMTAPTTKLEAAVEAPDDARATL